MPNQQLIKLLDKCKNVDPKVRSQALDEIADLISQIEDHKCLINTHLKLKEKLVQHLKDKNQDVRDSACYALSALAVRLPDPEALKDVFLKLLKRKGSKARYEKEAEEHAKAYKSYLGYCDTSDYWREVRDHVYDDRSDLRAQACKILGELAKTLSPASKSALIKPLMDRITQWELGEEDRHVCRKAYFALSEVAAYLDNPVEILMGLLNNWHSLMEDMDDRYDPENPEAQKPARKLIRQLVGSVKGSEVGELIATLKDYYGGNSPKEEEQESGRPSLIDFAIDLLSPPPPPSPPNEDESRVQQAYSDFMAFGERTRSEISSDTPFSQINKRKGGDEPTAPSGKRRKKEDSSHTDETIHERPSTTTVTFRKNTQENPVSPQRQSSPLITAGFFRIASNSVAETPPSTSVSPVEVSTVIPTLRSHET